MTKGCENVAMSAETTTECGKSAECEGLVQDKIRLCESDVLPLYGRFAEVRTEEKSVFGW